MSLPSRERGLKSNARYVYVTEQGVAPLAGAWIEMMHLDSEEEQEQRRSPRGSVD